MLKPFLAAALLAASIAAKADPADDARALLGRWVEAFEASDVDAIVSLYAPDALFFGTGSRTLATGHAGIRAYFERALTRNLPRSAALDEHLIRVLSDNVVVVTGRDLLGGVRDGESYAAGGRVSFVIEQRLQGWRIVHFHRSATPD